VNSLSGLTIIGLVLSAIVHMVAAAQAPGPKAAPLIVGKWKLNREKSNMPPVPAEIFELREYRLRPDGYLIGLAITSTAAGYHYLQFTAKSDGKDYPEYTDDLLADTIAAGKQTPRTYSESIVDEYTTDWVDKAQGRVIAHGKKTIAKDGRTLTVTQEETKRTFIYDRQ
jgi:hypothetical protein